MRQRTPVQLGDGLNHFSHMGCESFGRHHQLCKWDGDEGSVGGMSATVKVDCEPTLTQVARRPNEFERVLGVTGAPDDLAATGPRYVSEGVVLRR